MILTIILSKYAGFNKDEIWRVIKDTINEQQKYKTLKILMIINIEIMNIPPQQVFCQYASQKPA